MNGPSFVTSGDYDNDGDQDVVASSRFSDNFAFFSNQLIPNAPVVVGTPDLTGVFTKVRSKSSPGKNVLELEIQIRNLGDGPAEGFFGNAVYLSQDEILDTGDRFLRSLPVLAGLQAGQVDKLKFKTTLAEPAAGKYLLLLTDSGNVIVESSEDNNEAVALIP